ncbi:MAG: hypothetical protein IJD81_09845 [Oscillospiraceae bacterium]|nr:hypothetical protein [Oscillospiraceae bacterium]
MKKLIPQGRLVGGAIALVLLLILYFVVLFKLQIVEGAKYSEESANSIVSTETVAASRGNILDRYGRLLVSSRACHNIVLNTDELFEQEDPNAEILKLLETVEEYGETYNDDLPITMSSPFEFTDITAIQQTILDGYLKNAAVYQTPTAIASGLAKYSVDENGEKILDDNGSPIILVDEEITAVELMAFFRARYKIDSSYNNEETRKIAGMRYAINSRYIVASSEYIFVEDASLELITKLLESDFPGVEVKTSYVREYNTTGAAHILGYIGLMNDEEYTIYKTKGYPMDAKVGKEGAEVAFEEYLHGTDGQVEVVKTADGSVLKKVYTKEPIPGNNVYLTIDIVLQEAVERILDSGIARIMEERAVTNEEAIRDGKLDEVLGEITGAGMVVMDVKTGEPLAIASWPTFDLASLMENYQAIASDEGKPLFNRALSGIYAPGSTFKPVTAIACLTEVEETGITINTTIEDEGIFLKYRDAGYAPKCWAYGVQPLHGTVNVSGALAVSCNYFFYSIGEILGIDILSDYAKRFGLGVSTGIELPESVGVMSTQEYKVQLTGANWYIGDTIQASIGQAYNLFTPLQMATYISTIANSGERHTASILKRVTTFDYAETVYNREATVLSRVDSPEENYEAVRYGMYLVSTQKDGSAVDTFGDYKIPVASKTGTAQIGEGKTNNGIFVCFAPYDDPEVAIAIMVEHGKSGATIAFMAREALDAYFSIKETSENIESEMTLLQ